MPEEIQNEIYLNFKNWKNFRQFRLSDKDNFQVGCIFLKDYSLFGNIYIHLSSLSVHSNFRNKGLGKRLLLEFNRFVQENNYRSFLEDHLLPSDPSYDIYEKNGWTSMKNFSPWKSFNIPEDEISELEEVIAKFENGTLKNE